MDVSQVAPRTQVPALLIRVWSSHSDGHNSDHSFKSRKANGEGYTPPMTEIELQLESLKIGQKTEESVVASRKMLIEHTCSWGKDGEREESDDYISFTTSIMWAIHHALRKETTEECGSSDIRLTFVDTRKNPEAFEYTPDLIKHFDLPDEIPPSKHNKKGLMNARWHETEYLARGTINCCAPLLPAATITLEQIEAKHLFLVYPELLDLKRNQDVEELRRSWQERSSVVTKEEVNLVQSLGALFPEGLRLLAEPMFLSMKKRYFTGIDFFSWLKELAESKRCLDEVRHWHSLLLRLRTRVEFYEAEGDSGHNSTMDRTHIQYRLLREHKYMRSALVCQLKQRNDTEQPTAQIIEQYVQALDHIDQVLQRMTPAAALGLDGLPWE